MVERIRKRFAFIFLLCAIFFFYAPVVISLFRQEIKLPLPADTIVGLYNPFRDYYAKDYPNGIPFKNFLITDPVRQTFVWKELAFDILKKGQFPTWNPYEMAGKPLFANFQSSVLYPLNFLFLVIPFEMAWSFFIILQSILMGFFMYLYLRNLKLNETASALGASALTFSGFTVSWLEWGTIVHTGLWLPLILLSVDKLFAESKRSTIWTGILTASLCFSFFAGHLQIFFYSFVMAFAYFVFRWFQHNKNQKTLIKFGMGVGVFFIITLVQMYSTIRFILLSGRGIDQNILSSDGWFIPFRHLIQFLVPDFFGNPATLNYWGTWNYGELTGYIGLLPFMLVGFAFFRKNSTVIFLTLAMLVSLLFSLPTGVSSIPFLLDLPFISSAQPTRLIFIVTFSLSVLSAFGSSYLFENKKFNIKMTIPLILFVILFCVIWMIVVSRTPMFFNELMEVEVARRNLMYSSIILSISIFLFIFMLIVKRKVVREVVMVLFLLVALLDLLRFAQKFTPFADDKYLFPETKIINFLRNDKDLFRVAVMDRRIMPPNFFTHYKIQTIEGYDPLYLKSYAEYIVALERNSPNISKPYGFNRIITPHNYDSQLFDFLNTKYILTLDEINSPKLTKITEEGQTKIYLNSLSFKRAFFVKRLISTEKVIPALFQNSLRETAIVSEGHDFEKEMSIGDVDIKEYSENRILMKTSNKGEGYLVLSDTYYPTWRVYIDGKLEKIHVTNNAFRGVYIPKGNHTILFTDSII